MGLPLQEPSSSKYFAGLAVMVLITGALVLGIGYGALEFSSGPCDALYNDAVGGLKAEVEYLKESGPALGVNKVEIQELRSSTQVAGDSLKACCDQHADGAIDDASFQQCQDHAAEMAELPKALIAAHGTADAAKKAIRKASTALRGIAGDLTDIADGSAPGADANVAAGPPSEE
jgi:hypothetical protein